MILAFIAIFLAPPAPHDRVSLETVANASLRPSECHIDRPLSLWEKARTAKQRKDCSALSQITTVLHTNPSKALKLALKSSHDSPNNPSIIAVLGQAYVALGQWENAVTSFQQAEKIRSNAIEAPPILRDYVMALIKLEKIQDAHPLLKRLVLQSHLFDNSEERARIILQTVYASIALAESSSSSYLTEASSLLSEAEKLPPSRWSTHIQLSRILIHGLTDGVIDKSTQNIVNESDIQQYAARSAEVHAVKALGYESTDRAQAVLEWQAFINSPNMRSDFIEYAQKRISWLSKSLELK